MGIAMRGITFEIPNRYGKQLLDILKDIDLSRWDWQIGGGESYIVENDSLTKELFGTMTSLTGKELVKRISENDYYLIFVDLKAFPNLDSGLKVETYDNFLKSDCQFVLLVVDSSYVTIYSKDDALIHTLHDQAIAAKYKNIEYSTDENDDRIRLIAF